MAHTLAYLRIAGRVTAERAAPLVDLIGTVWIGGVSKLVPHFLREGNLNLDVVAESNLWLISDEARIEGGGRRRNISDANKRRPSQIVAGPSPCCNAVTTRSCAPAESQSRNFFNSAAL